MFCALITLLPLLYQAHAAPTAGRGLLARNVTARGVEDAHTYAFDNQMVPAEWTIIDGDYLVGVRQTKSYALGEKCTVSHWAKWHDRDNQPGWDAYVYCVREKKDVAWDVRRVGDAFYCKSIDQQYTYSRSHEEETNFGVEVGVGAAIGPLSASISASYSNTIRDTSSRELSFSCSEANEETTCFVGAPALVELHIREGWVTIKDRNSAVPEWWDRDDDSKTNGFREHKTSVQYQYNNDYPAAFDSWLAKGDECFVARNRAYDATVNK